jgi:putative transposase
MHTRRPARIQGFPYLGAYRYFVTCCTHARHSAFRSPSLIRSLTVQLLRTCRAQEFAVLAYVFMPDHLHLVLQGETERSDLRSAMRILRKRLSVEYHSVARGALWQDGYFERVLRDEERTTTVLAYVIANPLRAGLVDDARDYPFSWSIEWGEPLDLTGAPADHIAVRPTY